MRPTVSDMFLLNGTVINIGPTCCSICLNEAFGEYRMTDVGLSCRCGMLKGVLHDASRSVGNHVICYCKDCQKFCTLLGAEHALHEYGGTEIYQVPISQVEFTAGKAMLRCLRLTEKGAYRWYAGCCMTPIGNTGPSFLPMMGVIHACMRLTDPDTAIGPIRLDANRQSAFKPLPAKRQRGNAFIFLIKFLSQMLYWKVTKSKPNPLFDADGNPISIPTIGSL